MGKSALRVGVAVLLVLLNGFLVAAEFRLAWPT